MRLDLLERFDRLLAEVLAELPEDIRERLEETPVIADDRPSRQVMRATGAEDPRELCGLYTGVPLISRSIEALARLPDTIHVYREGVICATARRGPLTDEALKRQIRIVVLHEIGHHFGFGEAELRRLGYE